jgi:hypothetical protein
MNKNALEKQKRGKMKKKKEKEERLSPLFI